MRNHRKPDCRKRSSRFGGLFSWRGGGTTLSPRPAYRHLRIEGLENRCLLGAYALWHTFTAPSQPADAKFGFSVAAEENLVAVGAPGFAVTENSVTYPNVGRVFIFDCTKPDPEALIATIDNPNLVENGAAAAGGDQFGYSVAISGTTVVVGAPGYDPHRGAGNSVPYAGTAYVYSHGFYDTGGLWQWTHQYQVENPDLYASDPAINPATSLPTAAHDQFGYSVAISSSTVVVARRITTRTRTTSRRTRTPAPRSCSSMGKTASGAARPLGCILSMMPARTSTLTPASPSPTLR